MTCDNYLFLNSFHLFMFLCFLFSFFFRTLFIGHKLFKTLNLKKKTKFLPSYDLLVFLLEIFLSRNHQKKSGKFTVIRLTAYFEIYSINMHPCMCWGSKHDDIKYLNVKVAFKCQRNRHDPHSLSLKAS